MDRIADLPIRLPYGVVLETVTVLTYKSSKAHADRFIEFIKGNQQIIHDAPSAPYDMETFLVESRRISFVDALLKHMAAKEGLELVTFDQELLRAATAV